MSSKHVVVIGAGFSGVSAAAYLSQAGFEVTVLEKNRMAGGRAFRLKKDGFTFELGPTWYMMPDVFEEFFADFDKKPSDFYQLNRLNPHYRVFFNGGRQYDLSSARENANLFSQLEPGASVELENFLHKSRLVYEKLRRGYLPQDYSSKIKFLLPRRLASLRTMPIVRSYHSVVKQHFHDPRLQQILEYLCIFLGGLPKRMPGVFQAMVHADMNQGIWYPEGGFLAVAKGIEKIAKKHGAVFKYRNQATSIEVIEGNVIAVRAGKKRFACDYVVAACDYQYVEQNLLKPQWQSYPTKYWQRRNYTPSAVIISLGINTKLSNLEHHNLFFDTDWDKAVASIYKSSVLPEQPIFQVTVASKTSSKVAPKDKEALTIFVPIPNGVKPDKVTLDSLKQHIYERIGDRAQLDLSKHIVSEHVYSSDYFSDTFNASLGSAAGLSHVLHQSAFLRPANRSKKVRNLFFAGQDTNPGIGVPLCILSGKMVSQLIVKSQ
jgi:1-hydroxy-2-isopentenylcarotenoid 3,4-desaturase